MSVHYYKRDGTPAFTQPNKSKPGEVRDTTLTDAKKQGLLPSVSAYLSMLAQPGLVDWQISEAVRAAAACPLAPGEDVEEYIDAIRLKASQQVRDASDLGSRIHASIESFFKHGKVEDVTLLPYIDPVLDKLNALGISPTDSERVLVNNEYGYAGTTDLLFELNGKKGVLDFKSKRTKPGEKVFKSKTHRMQIAAYWVAAYGAEVDESATGFNIYISTTEQGRVDVVEYDGKQLADAWQAFKATLALYRFDKEYDARSAP